MTLGEIKIEALKLMFASYERDFSVSDLDLLSASEAYRDYLINMPGAINRAYAVLENSGVLPSASVDITASVKRCKNGTCEYDTSVLKDFLAVDRIIFKGNDGEYLPECSYRTEGRVLIIPEYPSDGHYILLYRPHLTRVTASTENGDVSGIPENIAVFIPYFIKGELYREEEPDEATIAHDLFMSAIDGVTAEKTGARTVEAVYFY